MVNKNKATLLRYLALVPAILATLCCCIEDTQYLRFSHIDTNGWEYGDTLIYHIAPSRVQGRSGINILLHTEGYKYQNIALNITITQDTTLLYNGQRSYTLDYNQPKNSIGRRCDYTLPIGNFVLCDTMPTTIALTHQINQHRLNGIREIGISIGTPLREPGEAMWRIEWN